MGVAAEGTRWAYGLVDDFIGCMPRSRRAFALCLLGASLVAGCGADKQRGAGGSNAARSSGGCKGADNALIAAARGHVGALRAGPAGDADRITVDVCRTTDQDATATVIVYGMHDRLTRDVRHEVRLIKVGGLWQVTGDQDTTRCQKGHGHQDFSGFQCQ